MSDNFDKFSGLEGELGQFRPAVPAGDLHTRIALRIEADIGPVSNVRSDRCLAGAMSLGLAACLMIAGMLGMDALSGPPSTTPTGMYGPSPVIAQTREFLAQLTAGNETWFPATTAPD